MVQINPDQLFAMLGKLQAELMVLRDESVAQEIKNKQLEAELASVRETAVDLTLKARERQPANRAERRRKAKES